MKDVALAAGVSVATVSHVINGTGSVTAETADRVRAAVKDLSYTPSAMGRIFKTGKKNLIGFIVPDISNGFFARIIEQVENTVAKQGYRLIIANTRETPENELDNLRLFSSEGLVDGLLLASTLENGNIIANTVPSNFPLVLVDRIPAGCGHYDTVHISNYRSLYQGVVELIKKGHKKIGFISGPMHITPSQDRLSAYKQALSDSGIPLDMSLVFTTEAMSESAYIPAEALVEAGCSAIITASYILTLDTLSYLQNRGITVNKDICVMGFVHDNNSDMAFVNNIDRISQPVDEMSQLAAQRILYKIQHPGSPVQNGILYSTLLLRK